VVQRFPGWRSIIKFALGALVRRRDIAEAVRQVRVGARSRLDWRDDPYYRGLVRLMAASERYGLKSAFYFKTSDRGPFDSGYDLSDEPALSMFREVRARGHEVGFHPGYTTFDDPAILALEKERFDAVSGGLPVGGRQHNLRFQAPETWRQWAALGLVYDSTVGYAEQSGFRCGTCHPFPVYDFVNDSALPLVEI